MCWRKSIKNFWIFSTIYLLSGCQPSVDNVIYVNVKITTGTDGKSWKSAFNNLQDALDVAITGEEIWVAAGTYSPKQEIGGSGDRYKSFQIKSGVAIYGGFGGKETHREQRDWKINETILSGDLNNDDVGFTNNDENSYHVVYGNDTDSTAIFDGFIITSGNANHDVWPDDGGGGMNNFDGSPTIRNCTFKSNKAFADGGGMRNWGDKSNPSIINCTFFENFASQEGGGMMNGPGSKPTVINCKFLKNSAGEDGGGIYNNESFNSKIINCVFNSNSANLTGGGMYNVNASSPNVINCTFSLNSAKKAGGAIANNKGFPTLINCILWNDSAPTDLEIHNINASKTNISYCNIAGGYEGIGNINKDPLFSDNDFRLSNESPCIDAGSNEVIYNWVKTDFAGNPRIINIMVDIGALEFEKTNHK